MPKGLQGFQFKHGRCCTGEYDSWRDIKKRCLNIKSKGYPSWGGRGIKVCKEWLDFRNFYKDMGRRPKGKSIDRIDNNGDYCKENCRWATKKEQCNNTRRNVFIYYKGRKRTIAQWSRYMGVNYKNLWRMIK